MSAIVFNYHFSFTSTPTKRCIRTVDILHTANSYNKCQFEFIDDKILIDFLVFYSSVIVDVDLV